ncbi:MAG: NAD(P)-dependent oxidoreductase [Candidatus Roizmanbacteria bacterium]|nr:NAD(P)-dependent oxidoreductase [Candidatus Roizmanbacteria bacterium]
MNILVTGATGFIGSHLVRRLLKLGHTLFIITRPHSDLSRINDILDNLIQVSSDPTLGAIHELFQKNAIDGVIHLATYYRKEDSKEEEKNMLETNIDFPYRLLIIAQQYGSTFFINTGTCFEYSPSLVSINEHSLIQPFNYYASTKFKFEDKLIESLQDSNLKALTLKLFFPYGEQDNNKLVRLLVESLIKKNEFHVTKGEQYLSYTYVHDIVDAYILALSHIKNMRSSYDIFNIGGTPIKVSNIFDTLEEISNKKGFIVRDKEYAKNEIMRMYTESEKAKKVLGWNQKFNLTEGLRKTYNYYLQY